MQSIATGAHELRIKGKAGEYRIIYYIRISDAIYLIHAFTKKTQKTSQQNIDTAAIRIKRL